MKKNKKLSLGKLKIAKIEYSEKVVGGRTVIRSCPYTDGLDCMKSVVARCVE